MSQGNSSSKSNGTSGKIYKPMASIAFKSSFYFGIIALLIVFLYCCEESKAKTFFNLLGIVIVIAFASFACGGIIGFLFGIPHTNPSGSQANTQSAINNNPPTTTTITPPVPVSTAQANTNEISSSGFSNLDNQSSSNFVHSTNLEQIADWLTKIIVGVGLTQIHKIIMQFNQLCVALGDTIKNYSSLNQNGSVLVGGVIILFSIEGFLIIYLWTYVYLIGIQSSSENDILNKVNSRLKITDLNDKNAIDLASKQLSLSDGATDISENDLTQIFQKASKNVLSSIFFKAVSIRKQFWQSNDTKSKIERTIPIFKALIAADSNLEYPENYAQLAFVLKDKKTPDYANAKIYLDKAINTFKDNDGITNKAIIFFNRAYCMLKQDSEFQKVPPSVSTPANKKLILNDLNEGSKEPYVKKIIDTDATVTAWKTLNPSA